MGKTKRDIETNREISIMCIVVLSILIVTFTFVTIIMLFSKIEINKKIENVQSQIETITYENNEIEDELNNYNELILSASNPKEYMNNLKEEYKALLPSIEKEVKSSESDKKIAYLNFTLTQDKYLDSILSTLSKNNVLANFYTNNSDLNEKITDNGHEVGLYINDNKTLNSVYEDNKSTIDSYNIDLFMTSLELNDSEVVVSDLKRVVDNTTSEGKSQLSNSAYAKNIVETTADRAFLIIRINGDNSIGKDALQSIISGLKEKGYIFLPLISKSTIFD